MKLCPVKCLTCRLGSPEVPQALQSIEPGFWKSLAQWRLRCGAGRRLLSSSFVPRAAGKEGAEQQKSPQCSYAFLAGYMTQGTRVAQEKLLIPSSAMDKAPQWFHTVLYGKRTFVQICSNSFHHCRYMRVQLR